MPRESATEKPLAKLRQFAGQLGWRGLQMRQTLLHDELITWYETTDRKFFLQINEHPPGQVSTYTAAVYAERYGICTGWHRFELSDPAGYRHLIPWLYRRQFKDRAWRRELLSRHPECYFERGSWPPPFFPGDATRQGA